MSLHMSLHVERTGERDRPEDRMERLFAAAFPAFITADQLAKQYIGRVREWFTDQDLILLDDDDEPAATGWGVPLRWTGALEDLPTGYTDSIVRAVEAREQQVEPDTLVICGAIVRPDLTGKGVAGELLTALRHLADDAGWPRVIAPVRPTLKARYPLTPIDSYITWTRDDGPPLDPWIRTHWRLGARIVQAAPESQTMTGTVAEWERWTGLVLPESGDYVIPDGLSLLHIDRPADLGTYVEPNVWMQHK
jgi:GNAT superfamily N-acetyltransferase